MFTVYDVCDMEIGCFSSVREFVEKAFYTRECHTEWIENMKECEKNDTLDESNYPYEESVQFYIDTIIAEKEPIMTEEGGFVLGWEWCGFTFEGDSLNI